MDKRLMERMKKLMENASVQEDNYKCPKCRDLGYVFVKDDDNNEVASPCECLAKRQAFEKLQKCGLSEAFKKKTFSTYTCSNQNQIQAKHKALVYCKEFLSSNSSLILSGHSGTGKTHLGIAVMLELINKNINCKYVEYNNMMVNLKQSVMDEENHMREMEKYLNPRVLFIDDFLKGKTTPADLNYIYRIINTRYITGKHVIISTERSIKEILQWDEAVGSRLVEMAGKNIITFDRNSQNHRLKDYLQQEETYKY